MRKFSQLLSIILIAIAVFYSFYVLLPSQVSGDNAPLTTFSETRALQHVKAIAQQPHYVGSKAHATVLTYIEGQLQDLGLETATQTGYTAGDWANLSLATNLMARIKGTGNGKALMLLAHYDSHPHSSHGASDDASGIATILESVRAFMASGKKPVNDIIILFSDAEELGLNGAQLFANKHPWVNDVGLILNFEARGSGGPGYMLIETNAGNTGLVKEFKKANPKYPVANSFMYSIYKMLPNDTDLTVFRETANINGFNFAFIDDHFDYHTQLDTWQRLDAKTLEHQGSYLMPLLSYFANADLSKVHSTEDTVYFNIPFFKLVSYPFALILPMLVLAVMLFLTVIVYAKRNRVISLKLALKGFIPFLLVLIINGLIGCFSWPLLKKVYPAYNDVLHGFTYNGHWYIAAFAVISIAVCFIVYGSFKKIRAVELSMAPLFFWLCIVAAVSFVLPGGAFFVVPFYFSLFAWFLMMKYRKFSSSANTLVLVPVIFTLVPFVQMFPVGLGLKLMVAATIFVSLIIGLLMPVIGTYEKKKFIGGVAFVIGVAFLIVAHVKAGFDKDSPMPTSLVYIADKDANTNYWATYNKQLTPWIEAHVGSAKKSAKGVLGATLSSKYYTKLNYVTTANELSGVTAPTVNVLADTVINNGRYLKIEIAPTRTINRLEVFSKNTKFAKVVVNNVVLDDAFLKQRVPMGKLITHYVTNSAPTVLEVYLNSNEKFSMEVVEAANNLLKDYSGVVQQRPENEIPMPFVLNDATITKKSYSF